MGCSGSRPQTNEELTVSQFEADLSISKCEVDLFISKVKKYSHQHILSPAQLKLVYSKLNLDVDSVVSSILPESKIYHNLQENGVYQERHIVALGILMGKGSNDKKARLLFEEWDSALNGSLLETQVNDMVDVLVRIAIDVIPNACAVSPDLEATTSVSRSKLVTFIDQIGGVQNTVKQKMKRDLMQSRFEIPKRNFISQCCMFRAILSPSGIRRAHYDEVKSSGLAAGGN